MKTPDKKPTKRQIYIKELRVLYGLAKAEGNYEAAVMLLNKIQDME